MSNSLTINVPNPVKQNTPLRNVPSGSTAEPDYSVKYVPQSLTEEQKAQARANIGAAAAGSAGGAAPEIDRYWVLYTKGDTTLSSNTSSILEVWMNGDKINGNNGVWTILANSIVRIKGGVNPAFVFSNTTDDIWLWCPNGIAPIQPVYGDNYNVNLVLPQGGGQNINFGGKVWLMQNKLFADMLSMTTQTSVANSPIVYLNDTTIDASALPNNFDWKQSPCWFYVPQNRYDEFIQKLSEKGFSQSILAHRTVTYTSIIQNEYVLDVELLSEPTSAVRYVKMHSDTSFTLSNMNNRWYDLPVAVYNNGIQKRLYYNVYNDGEDGVAQYFEYTLTCGAGENILVFAESPNIGVPTFTQSGATNLWIEAQNVYANPLIKQVNPTDVNVVYGLGVNNASFGYECGGTSWVYTENNRIDDGRFWWQFGNRIVFTDQPMSGINAVSDTDISADVNCTMYVPKTRYQEFVNRLQVIFAATFAANHGNALTVNIVTYDYISEVGYKKSVVNQYVFDDYNVVVCKTNSNGQIRCIAGQYASNTNVNFYVDEVFDGRITFNTLQSKYLNGTYSADTYHVVRYKADNNKGNIFTQIGMNAIEYIDKSCNIICQKGYNNNGNNVIIVGYPHQLVPQTGQHGGESAQHGIQHFVITNPDNSTAVQALNYYVDCAMTPVAFSRAYTGSTIYVPKGTGSSWQSLNANSTVVEYDILIRPPYGTAINHINQDGSNNVFYDSNIPKAVSLS